MLDSNETNKEQRGQELIVLQASLLRHFFFFTPKRQGWQVSHPFIFFFFINEDHSTGFVHFLRCAIPKGKRAMYTIDWEKEQKKRVWESLVLGWVGALSSSYFLDWERSWERCLGGFGGERAFIGCINTKYPREA